MANSRLYQPTEDDIAAEVVPHAATRKYRNRHSPTNVGIIADADNLGVIGERAVVAFFGEDPDRWIQSERNTDGWFMDIAGVKIKAYATHNPGHIVVKTERVEADAYVLVYVLPTGEAFCLGWAHRSDILAAEILQTSGGDYALRAYWHPRNRNRPLGPLRERLAAAVAAGTVAEVESIAPIITGAKQHDSG